MAHPNTEIGVSHHESIFFRESSGGGLLLLNADLAVMHANREAIDILVYPENPRNVRSLEKLLAEKIRSVLRRESTASERAGFAAEVVSGRRRYTCRSFSLGFGCNDDVGEPLFAVLVERPVRASLDTVRIAQAFHLTQRELETMEFILQGFTSKEIASRMRISPNTVKAFIRIIMMKTGTSTRSAIVGKVLPLIARPQHAEGGLSF